jgi:outer membrane protein TolC
LLDAMAEGDKQSLDVVLSKLERDQAAQSTILPRVDLGASAGVAYIAPSTNITSFPVTNPDGSVSFQASTVDLPGYFSPSFRLQATASQKIYDGGRWWNAIDKSRVDARVAEARLQEARLQARLGVAHAFFEVVRAGRNLVVLRTHVSRSEEQVVRAEGVFEGGRGSKADILAAQANLAQDRLSVAQQEATQDLARTNLLVLLGRDPHGELAVAPPAIHSPEALPPRAELQSKAESGRPAIVALRRSIESSQLQTKLARADYYPSVSAQLGYTRDSSNPLYVIGNPARQFVANIGLNVSWNVFAGWSTDVAVEKAQVFEAQADANLTRAQRGLGQEVERAARNVEAQSTILKLAESARVIATQALAVASERFRQGAGPQSDVRDAEIKLTQAELALASTQIDHELARLDLDAAVGAL